MANLQARTVLDHADTALIVLGDDAPEEFHAAAELDTATAHIGLRDAEVAGSRIEHLLALAPELRTTPIVERVTNTGTALRLLADRTGLADDLSDCICLFTRYAASSAKD